MTEDPTVKYRILAVDDDPTILDLYRQILNSDAKIKDKHEEYVNTKKFSAY